MPAGTIAIRDGHTGALSPAASSADVLAAIQAGDDIVVNGATAILSNIGGPSGTWLINGQPIVSFFLSATGPTVSHPNTGPNVNDCAAAGTCPGKSTGGPPYPAPNGVTQYYDSNMHLLVWNPYQGIYVDQGGSDYMGIFGFGVLAVVAYFLFFRK